MLDFTGFYLYPLWSLMIRNLLSSFEVGLIIKLALLKKCMENHIFWAFIIESLVNYSIETQCITSFDAIF